MIRILLTFSGRGYVTSGRITALAMTPICENNDCKLWVGAAGGGVWYEQGARSQAKLDIRLGQLRDQRDRDADLRRCDRHALRGNRRAKRIGGFGSRFWDLQINRQRHHVDAPGCEHERAADVDLVRGRACVYRPGFRRARHFLDRG